MKTKKTIRIRVRDLFGRVVFDEVFHNLPRAVRSLGSWIHFWPGSIGGVVVGDRPKKTFKVYQTRQGGFFLKSHCGEIILLPNPVEDSEEFEEFEFEEGGEDPEEPWDPEDFL